MAAHTYEGMFILDSNRYARDPGGLANHVRQILENHGGEVLVSRLWEERRLAYPIGGQRKGTYWLTYFKTEAGNIGKIERDCQLSENVLRALVLKIDERIAEHLVAHALGAPEAKPAGDAKPAAEGKPAETKPAKEAAPAGA